MKNSSSLIASGLIKQAQNGELAVFDLHPHHIRLQNMVELLDIVQHSWWHTVGLFVPFT